MLSALIWDVTNVILYRNKWIFDVIHAIMVLLSEMRVTVTAEYYKITNKNEFSGRSFFTVRLWIKK